MKGNFNQHIDGLFGSFDVAKCFAINKCVYLIHFVYCISFGGHIIAVKNETSSWNLEFRTIEALGTVLYNSGHDFVALEMVDGKLRFLVGKGSNAVELISELNTSDGKWHNVSIAYSPLMVEVESLLYYSPLFF